MTVKEKVKRFFHNAEKEGLAVRGKAEKSKSFSSSKAFENEELAKLAFQQSKKKLFDVNRWTEIPNPLTASFKIYDPNGFPSKAIKVNKGDYIKINLPGPFPDNWVKVIALKESDNCAEFIVTPSDDPTIADNKTKHFFEKGATSTFRTEIKGKTIYAYEIGKHEVVNVNEDKDSVLRKAANVVMAEGGWAGMQKLQWKNLTNFLVMESL